MRQSVEVENGLIVQEVYEISWQETRNIVKPLNEVKDDDYCGMCNETPCQVSAGNICCHQSQRPGGCNCPEN